jgi:hypothetical protein
MKTPFVTSTIVCLLILNTALMGQINIPKNVKPPVNTGNLLNNSGSNALSNDEVVKGLKEALNVGTGKAVEKVSVADGFYKNPQIKIPFPPETKKMESTLRQVGMGKQVDEFVQSLNRAAEDASKSVVPVFTDAIRQITIQDGMSILKGGNDRAATEYLQSKTNTELQAKIRPIVAESIRKARVAQYYKPLADRYNKVPGVQKVNPDLEQYVTARAIEGLFKMIAEEEIKIRKDPASRITDILKKVFG